ncbi:MAG TPA: alpha/beta hydrolase [Longilinea sp.]|nr:alpha/beta hydrolase [Longilinea sp.]
MNKKWLWFSPLIVIVLIFGGFSAWAYSTADPMAEALAAVEDSSSVDVQSGDYLVFSPVDQQTTTGLIIYPGGRVDYRAYAPLANRIAQEGYLVVIVPMPFNLAVFGIDAADAVIADFPQIQTWAIAGHSLGGSMATHYVVSHPGEIAGMVLWASYPAESDDLSQMDIRVASIYGSNDGLATPEKVLAAVPLLPSDTMWVEIAGGNHAQFGWYGPQSGDNEATIDRADQQAQIAESTLLVLEQIQGQ